MSSARSQKQRTLKKPSCAHWLYTTGTFFLIYCALMLEERPQFFKDPSNEEYWKAAAEPFLIGWLVTALVMSMAGPTGYAANPARDMSPRIMHWLLPIPNKGPSEFWCVVWSNTGGRSCIVPFCGGVIKTCAC